MNFFFKRIYPRWFILIFDTLIITFSLYLAYLLRFNFTIDSKNLEYFQLSLLTLLPVRLLFIFIFRTHADIIRYTTTENALHNVLALLSGSFVILIANLFAYHILDFKFLVPFSILLIELFISTSLILGYRMFIKMAWMQIMHSGKEKKNILIFGASQLGLATKHVLEKDKEQFYNVVGFIDEDEQKIKMKLEGVPIYHTSKLPKLLASQNIYQLIIAAKNITAERKKNLVDIALQYNTKVSVVPPIEKWVNGQFSVKQLKSILIEDLLERDVININNNKVFNFFRKQIVLVTGAAGSIGSELVKQIALYNPQKVICIDRDENNLFYLKQQLQQYENIISPIIADITDEVKMQRIFDSFRPHTCFHAAAYKHVPMMEEFVSEAICNNIFGTIILADLAHKFNCQRFILISTDKAVNPSSVMGATKRFAEIYCQALNAHSQTRFITTRFGNVLGSNGSVISIFRRQIENGGPITVTHPEVTRYFMTNNEACQLVIEAATMGEGGEVFVFDMGQPVKIVDLAKKMIKLSGLELGKEIQIKYTGLRPGEKLCEELFNNSESYTPTYHKRILIAKVKQYNLEEVKKSINELKLAYQNGNNIEMIKILKQVIPEYKSQNSVYQILDSGN